MKEHKTMETLMEFLRKNTDFRVVEMPGWFYAVKEGAPGGKRIAFRADMDALPIQETRPLPYASCRKGVFHACGHDGHCAALAGLAALSGPLHGGMAARVQAFMDEVSRRGPHRAIAARQDQALPIPGFGHPLYPEGDPRARALLDAFAPPPLFAETEAAVAALTGEPPNIDFALTALAERLDLPPEAP